jgi:glutamine amidotransferase
MGWNELKLKKHDVLLKGIEPGSFVYFVHSYYADPGSQDVTLATTDHGLEFAAIVHRDNVWATQFHPEKSQKVGEHLLDNFGRL